jgi:hypothetical protein
MHPVLRAPTALVLIANFSVTSLTTSCKHPRTSQACLNGSMPTISERDWRACTDQCSRDQEDLNRERLNTHAALGRRFPRRTYTLITKRPQRKEPSRRPGLRSSQSVSA